MSPKTPRDVSSKKLIKVLSRYGYKVERQSGSHIRLTLNTSDGARSITVPNHHPIKLGTLMSIITDISLQLNIDRTDIIDQLS
jgi:predicted RNA binding protein YcfA (HicA-like mRNA interferase family)